MALTFDDGPKPEHALPILEILDQYAVKATFFVVGQEAARHSDLVLRMFESGHDLGSHSYSHRTLTKVPRAVVRDEIRKTNRVIQSIIGKTPHYFRAPGGMIDGKVMQEVNRSGMRVVSWTINTTDYVLASDDFEVDANPSEVADRMTRIVEKKISPGAILLFHNGGMQTILALPRVLDLLKRKGYRCVTMSELLGQPSYFTRLPQYSGLPGQE